jgi:hypothetical protein
MSFAPAVRLLGVEIHRRADSAALARKRAAA